MMVNKKAGMKATLLTAALLFITMGTAAGSAAISPPNPIGLVTAAAGILVGLLILLVREVLKEA